MKGGLGRDRRSRPERRHRRRDRAAWASGVDGAVGPAGPDGAVGPAGSNGLSQYAYLYNTEALRRAWRLKRLFRSTR